jgi:CspA family cold shock protein
MTIGIVKFFNTTKGFGFIVPEEGGKDIFVNSGAVELAGISGLTKGQRLSFETEADPKGAIKAVRLKPHADPTGALHAGSPKPQNTVRQTPNRPASRSVPLAVMDVPDGLERAPTDSHKHNAWQRSYDRYCALAQNAVDDRVARENYWQYAEHFLRMMNGSAD